MEKPIEEYTDAELMSVIRQAENTHISGSRYQKAKNEWEMRQQLKLAQATANQKGGIFFEVGGDMIHDGDISTGEGATVGISVAGDYTNKKGKISQGRDSEKVKYFFSMDNPPIYIVVVLIVSAIGYCGLGIGKSVPSINNDAPIIGSIETVGQTGGTNVIVNRGNNHEEPISGVVNGVNKVFVWKVAPSTIVEDGVPRLHVQSDGTILWTGSTTTDLLIAPNFNIFGQY